MFTMAVKPKGSTGHHLVDQANSRTLKYFWDILYNSTLYIALQNKQYAK